MKFNIVDILTLAYVGYGAVRGWTRGLSRELPRAAGITLAFVTGWGLYRWTERLLLQTQRFTGQKLGVFGVIGILVASFFLVRHFKGRVQAWADKKFPAEKIQKRGGMAAGALRTFLIAAIVIIFASHILRGMFAENSLIGWFLTRFVVPVQKITQG
jgi:uncharacterized membrane protein required for colicin V production